MDVDDEPMKQQSPLAMVLNEDLSTASLDELAERIDHLKQEILRVESVISSKKSSHLAAESAFKS